MINSHHLSLTHFIVHAALHLPHSSPALLFLHLRIIVEDLVPQPGQIVDTHLVFLALIDKEETNFSNYLNAFKVWFKSSFDLTKYNLALNYYEARYCLGF